jgi:hypothetical protein
VYPLGSTLQGGVIFSSAITLNTASNRDGPGSSLGQVMWDLWWTECQCGRFLSEYFGFPYQMFHRLLHTNHHPSPGAGKIGKIVADIPSALILTLLKKLRKTALNTNYVEKDFNAVYRQL